MQSKTVTHKVPKASATVTRHLDSRSDIRHIRPDEPLVTHSGTDLLTGTKRKLFIEPLKQVKRQKQLLSLPGYDAPAHSPPRRHTVVNPDEQDSQVAILERNKQNLLNKIRVKKQELLLKQEIAALNDQLLGIDPSIPVPRTEAVYSPTTTELDAADTGIHTPMHVPLPVEPQTQAVYVATQADRSRSMSPVYSDHSVHHMEEYDPLHPTMSTSRCVTPAQRSYPDSVHSLSSRGSDYTVPDIVEPEDTSITSKIQIVRSILDLPQHTVAVQSPYTKSAPEKVPKTSISALPRVAGFSKVFTEFQQKLRSGEGTKIAVKPPTLPRHFRPTQKDLQPIEQRINPAFTHIKTSYATGQVRLHYSEVRLLRNFQCHILQRPVR